MTNTEILLENIVKSIVYYPDDVKVERTVDDMGILLTLTVNPSEVGLIIGRTGIVAKAIRQILREAGKKAKETIHLRIQEPKHDLQ